MEQALKPVQLRKMVESFSSQLQVRVTTTIKVAMVAMDTAVAEQETTAATMLKMEATMAPMVEATSVRAGRAQVSTLER